MASAAFVAPGPSAAAMVTANRARSARLAARPQWRQTRRAQSRRCGRPPSPGEASGVAGAGGTRSPPRRGRLATTLPADADRMAAMLLLDADLPGGFAAPWP